MNKFWRNTKGAVNVFVTLMLIPAILVTGTAVDLTSVYAAKAYLKDAEQLAANSLLADYDKLLRDIYALYAVTEDDEEMTAVVNAYLAATLFGELYKPNATGTGSRGRILFNSVNAESKVEAADQANLRNTHVLRRQIEDYVKFRAPEYVIENILDSIEKFTKFLPDMWAIILKLLLDQSMAQLMELYEQFYYSVWLHDLYLHELCIETGSAPSPSSMKDPAGLEVSLADETSEKIAGLHIELTLISGWKQTYEYAVLWYQAAAAAEDEAGMEEARKLMEQAIDNFNRCKANAQSQVNGAAETAAKQGEQILKELGSSQMPTVSGLAVLVNNIKGYAVSHVPGGNFLEMLTNVIFPVQGALNAILEFTTAMQKQKLSGSNAYYSKNGWVWGGSYVKPYIQNIHDIGLLIPVIEAQAKLVDELLKQLEAHLPSCSSALRGTEKNPGLQQQLEQYKQYTRPEDIHPQYNVIKSGVTDNSGGAYFYRLGMYLNDPDAELSNGNIYKLSQIKTAVDSVNITDEGNPALFDEVALSSAPVKIRPYFKTITAGRYIYFTDSETVSDLFMLLYESHGGDSYFSFVLEKFKTFLEIFGTNLVKEFKNMTKGFRYDPDGASMSKEVHAALVSQSGGTRYDTKTPLDVMAHLGEHGLNLTNNPITTITNTVSALLDFVHIFTDLIPSFKDEGVDILNKMPIVAYNIHMFSCYTTKDGGGDSYSGYPYSTATNNMFGSEQEYLIFGHYDSAPWVSAVFTYIPGFSSLAASGAERNVKAAAGMIFSIRFVFNFISSFIVQGVNKFCMAVEAETAGLGIIVRIGLVYGETLLDVFRLRGGSKVAIVKILDSQWTVGNLEGMAKKLGSELTSMVFKLIDILAKSVGQTELKYSYLKSLDSEEIYGSAQTLQVLTLYATRKNGKSPNEEKKAIMNVFMDGFKEGAESWVKKADLNQQSIDKAAEGFKSNFVVTDAMDRWNRLENGEEAKVLQDDIKDAVKSGLGDLYKELFGKTYSDYLAIFMSYQMFWMSETMLARTGDLITLNMAHIKEKVGAGNAVGTDAVKRHDLRKAHTAFNFETTANIKLVFLSMPFARKGVNGITPPTELEIIVRDKRGY